MDKVWRIGLTGGIGSGKSTAAKVLAQLGAAVIDADAWARSVIAPGGTAIAPLRAAFGEAVLDAQGGLDRQRMRELAFSDPQVKAQLEAIVHPLVKQAIDQQAQSALAAGARVLVVGTGPAGFTLAHYLMNDGHTVVAIDGLKIEPLAPSLSGVDPCGERVAFAPVRDIAQLGAVLGREFP
jgi:NADPH-dependent 2,4-dienoyl-CoA reductase/sulfur reductase-like enzyme